MQFILLVGSLFTLIHNRKKTFDQVTHVFVTYDFNLIEFSKLIISSRINILF